MQEGPSTAQDAHYRRGVVLGLTIGESILLILFSLLLVLSVPLIKQTEKNQELEKKLAEAKTEYTLLKKVISKLDRAAPGKNIEDLTKEYVLMAEQIKKMEAQLKQLKEASAKMAEKILANKELRETVSEILGRDISTLEPSQLDKALREMAEDVKKSQLSELSQKELVESLVISEGELKKTLRQLANTKGQLENLKRQLSQGGRGVEAVPCWSKSKGKPEYIFDVALTTNGLIIRDRKLPHRKDEQSKLPLDRITFESELTRAQFRAEAKPLYDWSVAHKCRFFVRVFDKTADAEKTLYKRHLRYVGERFYPYEELDEQF